MMLTNNNAKVVKSWVSPDQSVGEDESLQDHVGGGDQKGEGDSQDRGGVVLASQVLPDRIYLLPTGSKPAFPGVMFPVVIPPEGASEAVKATAREVPERVIGFVLTRHEESMSNFAQIEEDEFFGLAVL